MAFAYRIDSPALIGRAGGSITTLLPELNDCGDRVRVALIFCYMVEIA